MILKRLFGRRWRKARASDGAPAPPLGPVRATPARTPIALALQGGGAHGAFTWGVLDRLLEADDRRIEAISGTSAGALNAAVMASGYLDGGAAAARQRLSAFWQKVAELARMNPLQPTPVEIMTLGRNAEFSVAYILRDVMLQMFSPYQLNPLDLNPLRQLLLRFVDFDRLREPGAIRLLIAATKIDTGEARIFTNQELSADVLLASACLPSVQQAVRLHDGYYWDGGFTANPPVLALIEVCEARDILLVRLNPASERELPVTAPSIQSRINRIVFDAPLKRELETIERLRRMSREGAGGFAHRLAGLRIHTICEDDVLGELGGASKMHPHWDLVRFLRDVGQDACGRWLDPSAVPAPRTRGVAFARRSAVAVA